MASRALTNAGAAVAAGALALLTACGSPGNGADAGGGTPGYPEPRPTSASPATSPTTSADTATAVSGADLAVGDSTLGQIVVDANGMTVYYFTKDTPGSGKSACAGPCLQAWPPVTASSERPQAEGLTAEVGTISAEGGERQLTVGGRPVYLFAKDTRPGDVNGQGVNGVWYVVRPDGTMVTATTGS